MGYVFREVGTARCAVRAAFSGASTGWTDSRDKAFRPLHAGGDAAARRPYRLVFERSTHTRWESAGVRVTVPRNPKLFLHESLIPIVLRLVRAFHRHAEIVGLLLCELRQLHAEAGRLSRR